MTVLYLPPNASVLADQIRDTGRFRRRALAGWWPPSACAPSPGAKLAPEASGYSEVLGKAGAGGRSWTRDLSTTKSLSGHQGRIAKFQVDAKEFRW